MVVAHQAITKNSREISSLVLPTQGRALLLPNVAVAEIVPEQQLMDGDSQNWLIGLADWRSMKIPVVSFERMLGKEVKFKKNTISLAVLNGFLGHQNLPFYGIALSGLPSLERIVASELVVEGAGKEKVEQFYVIVSGEKATIPNLHFLETQLLEEMSKKA